MLLVEQFNRAKETTVRKSKFEYKTFLIGFAWR